MSGCPNDNSSEAITCLLRHISNNTGGFDWNPLNFAVTAAIGLLALVIAGITVFQGLLAAGPGRIKASNLAIGPFSVHSRSRFDRTELALRTTARVPLITWDVVYHRIVRQKYKPGWDNPERRSGFHHRRPDLADGEASEDDTYNVSTRAGKTSLSQRHQYDSTATWLTLLTAIGLDDPQFFPLVQRVTDYIPADIQAAPAAAELRCLAILAVIADANATIEPAGPGNRFIRVSADSSQLGFREHPSLGAVAAYEAYEETAMLKVGSAPALQFGVQFPVIKYEDLDRCLQLASGRLAYANGRIPLSIDGQADERGFFSLIRDLAKRSGDCGHDICTHAVEDWNSSARALRERHKPWLLIRSMQRVYMAMSLLAAERANMCRGFPRVRMKLREALRDIVKLNTFWSTEITFQKSMQLQSLACVTFWGGQAVPSSDTLSASWVVKLENVQSVIPNPFTNMWTTLRRQHFKEDKTAMFMQSIRAFVTRETAEDPAEAPVSEIEGDKLSSQLAAQLLTCIDEWLFKKGGSMASCGMLRMLYELGAEAGLLPTKRDLFEDVNLWEMLGSSKDIPVKPNGWGPRYFDHDSSVNMSEKLPGVSISTLLVLRGVLFALLLDDGADTSILYESDFRNSVVRML